MKIYKKSTASIPYESKNLKFVSRYLENVNVQGVPLGINGAYLVPPDRRAIVGLLNVYIETKSNEEIEKTIRLGLEYHPVTGPSPFQPLMVFKYLYEGEQFSYINDLKIPLSEGEEIIIVAGCDTLRTRPLATTNLLITEYDA